MYKVYKIQVGDTLEEIANKNNTTVELLEQLNGPLDNLVDLEYIIVPNNQSENFKTYYVKKGDSLYSIARANGISVDDLVMLNGLNKNEYIYPNQQLLLPNENVDIYITRNGDTIESLVERFNVDYGDISKQNSKIYLLPEQLIMIKKK